MTALTALDVQQLLAAEPFVRELARSLVAGDADEVVQQVWVRALRRRGGRVRDPRHWLARVVRSVAANLHRSDTRRRAHEQAAARADRVPSSLRLLELEETRRSLLAAVDALPAPLRAVVLLRFYDGLPPRRVARELCLPVAVVWRQQQRALALLRARLGAQAGDRASLARALVPLALAPRGLPWCELSGGPAAAAVCTGVVAMTVNSKILGAAILLLLLAIPLAVAWPPAAPGPAPDAPPARAHPAGAALADTSPTPAASAGAPGAGRTELRAAPAATGALAVRVQHAADRAPAAGVAVIAWPARTHRLLTAQRRVTDRDGTAEFDELPLGRWHVATDRAPDRIEIAEIRAGANELLVSLAGVTLTGVVTDLAGSAVAGAVVEIAPVTGGTRAEPVATTGPDGRFRVRGVRVPGLVGARAAGHASSECAVLMEPHGDPVEVRLVLPAAGGVVEGTISGPDGPIAGAAVQVGPWIAAGGMRSPPQPAVARSDAAGRFRAIGVPAGRQEVRVRAAGLAPWLGACTVEEHATTSLHVPLQRGATVRGVVCDADGTAVAGASVAVGEHVDPFTWHPTRTRDDGTFLLADLPPGDVELAARHEQAGKGSLRVRAEADAITTCELRLARGVVLQGRVVFDDTGEPVAGASVVIVPGAGHTDATGRFAIGNCPEGRTFSLTVYHADVEPQRFMDVGPRAGGVELRVRRLAAADASIHGLLVGPDGRPRAGVAVQAGRGGIGFFRADAVTGQDGRFGFERLLPGDWWLTVATAGHPEVRLGPLAVAPGAVHDAGTLRLAIGGTVRARLLAGEPTGVRFQVHGRTQRHFAELQLDAGGLTSGPLDPGDYELAVFGAETAEQTVPFAVRAGEETQLELRLLPGVRQRIEIAPGAAPGGTADDRVHVVVRRDDELVRRREHHVRTDGRPCAAELWLAPGSYSLTATCGTAEAAARFTVGALEGPPVRVELR